MVETLTTSGMRAWAAAVSQAQRFNCSEVHAEHVLLGLAEVDVDGSCGFGALGLVAREVQREIELERERGRRIGLPPYTADALAAFANACAVAAVTDAHAADGMHLLLAVFDAPSEVVSSLASRLGGDVVRLRRTVWPAEMLERHESVSSGVMPLAVFADWLEERGISGAAGVRWLVDRDKFPIEADDRWFWHHSFSPFIRAHGSILPYAVAEKLSIPYVDCGMSLHAAARALARDGRLG